MELEEGMYVRTKGGFIDKIISFKSTISNDYVELEDEYYANKKDILKASHNIIDLIEVGDYVNGLKVSSVGGTYYGRKDKAIYCDYCENKETGKWTMIYDDEIKSIVTKEQFSSMEYRLGDDK